MSSYRPILREKCLYDLFIQHRSTVLSTLHLLVVMLFNHHAMEVLPYMSKQYPFYAITFEVLFKHVTFCQTITLFTLLMIYISPVCISKRTTMRTHIVVMTLSFAIKYIYGGILLYQYPILAIPKKIRMHNTFYSFIEMSYMIRILGTMCIMLIVFIDKFDSIVNYLKKKYKIKNIDLLSDQDDFHEV